jgi:adenylate cyclase
MKSLQHYLTSKHSVTDLITHISDISKQIYADLTLDAAEKEKSLTTALEKLLSAPSIASENKSHQVTVLFAEIQNFTAISKILPDQAVVETLNRYFSVINDIIVTQFKGSVKKILGDCLMAVFDTPQGQDDKLQAALSCAIQMQIAMKQINETNCTLHLPALYIGIGIHSGEIMTGQFGSSVYSENTLVGNDINIASYLKNRSSRGQILISQNTYQRAKSFIETGAATPLRIKETLKSINVYQLYAIKQPHYLAAPKVGVRQSPRVLVNVPIVYQCLEDETTPAELYSGEIIDISYGGMFACVSHLPQLYSEIKFTLTLSALSKKSSVIYAKVLTISKEQDKFYIGTAFTHLDDETQFSIEQVIDVIREVIVTSQSMDFLAF